MEVMDIKQIIGEFFDSAIRVESVIHLGTMCMDDAWPDIAREAFEDDADDVWLALGTDEPEEEDREAWREAIRDARKLGFLIKFATPIPENFYEGGHSFSWGYYTTHWIYDDCFESACEKAIKWQEEFVEKMREKEAKEAK